MVTTTRLGLLWLGLAICLASGCMTPRASTNNNDIPRESQKVPLPPYVVEPPDILLIDALRVIPKPPYLIQPLDVLTIQATDVIATEPISGLFTVDPDGTVNLGPKYGAVKVAGLKLENARDAIVKYLRDAGFDKADAKVALAQSQAQQQIRGEHLVRPDGTIGLGTYGSVPVVGLTLDETRQAIEAKLSQFLDKPEISVDVFAYNSKVYYVVTDGGGYGEGVYPFPITGNETVLDAISKINGLPAVASKRRIWLARPDPTHQGCCNCYPVDWNGVVRCGDTRTNYQVMPGDRVYVQAEPLVTIDSALARIISPVERILGVTLLGSETVHSIAIPLGQSTTGAAVP
jgi:polysaccharide export outer membrane protein